MAASHPLRSLATDRDRAYSTEGRPAWPRTVLSLGEWYGEETSEGFVMFDGAPQEVARLIRLLPIRSLHPNLRYIAAAGLLTEHYLGVNFARLRSDDPFLRFEKRLPDGRLWQFPARVIQVAQIIFELRNDPGFSEFCRRLSGKRDLQSAFAETAGAAMLKVKGFTIEAKPESYVRTKDFDFTASMKGVTVNVEVFALRRDTFSPDALLSRLKDKRKQLPNDAPAMIICFYPNEWRAQATDLHLSLVGVAARFFTSSDRINCILFAREEWEEQLPVGGGVSLSAFSVVNYRPRHFNSELAEAVGVEPDSHEIVEYLMETGEGLRSSRGNGEFYDWVDWVISANPFRPRSDVVDGGW